MKKKLEEKQIEILLQIINEEVELAYDELLLEQEDDMSYDTGKSGGGGIARFWRDRGQLPGLLLSPISDLTAAFKKFGAKMGVAVAGLIGMTISSAIAALLPFNDPRTVKYIGKKFLAWESKSMKFIDEQFKTETAQMRQGWETFKTDFWGIGFVASPFGAISAAIATAKGVDAALSVGNIITGGKIGALIDKIITEVEDPGDLNTYLKRGRQEEKEKREKRMEKDIYSARCLAQLDNPNWIDPECLGFADRKMFPDGPKGQQDFIRFVQGNAYKIKNARQDQYKIEFGKDPGYEFYQNLKSQPILNLLKNNGLISENYVHEQLDEGFLDSFKNFFTGKKETSSPPSSTKKAVGEGGDINSLLDAALKDAGSSNAGAAILRMRKKFGKEKTDEILKEIGNALVNNSTAQAAAQAWTNANLPKVAAETFGSLNQELISGQVPNVTLPQMKAYIPKAGDLAVQAIQQTANSKKINIPPDSLNIIKNAVQANTNQTLAQIQNIPDQPAQVPAQQPTKVPAAPAPQAPAAPKR